MRKDLDRKYKALTDLAGIQALSLNSISYLMHFSFFPERAVVQNDNQNASNYILLYYNMLLQVKMHY